MKAWEKEYLDKHWTKDQTYETMWKLEQKPQGRLWLINRMVGKTPKRILDVGCGKGGIAKMLIRSGHDCKGIDIAPSAVDYARKFGIDCYVADVEEELPFLDGTFDVVVIGDTLEHLLRPQKALAEINRVLTPQGVLIVSVPNLGFILVPLALIFYQPAIKSTSALGVWDHIQQFTLNKLEKLLRETGFEIGEVHAPRLVYYPKKKQWSPPVLGKELAKWIFVFTSFTLGRLWPSRFGDQLLVKCRKTYELKGT